MKKFIAVLTISMFFSAGVKAEDLNSFEFDSLSYEDVVGDVLGLDVPDFISDTSAVSEKNLPKKDLKELTVMFYSNSKDQLRSSQITQIGSLSEKEATSTQPLNMTLKAMLSG